MTKTATLAALAAILAICSASCTKKGSTGATGQSGPPGPSYKGVIRGHVSVYDAYGARIFTGLDGINVTLKGVATVVTDINGSFIFDSVSTGNYELQATGAGLAGTMINNVAFIKDTFYTDIKLSTLPQFNINSFNAYHNAGSAYDSLIVGFTADTRARNVIIFVNKTSVAGNQPGTYLLSYVKPLPVSGWGTTTNIKIPASDLNYAGMFYGDRVYYTAASYVVSDASAYEDPNTGQNVYNAVGTLAADSTTCP